MYGFGKLLYSWKSINCKSFLFILQIIYLNVKNVKRNQSLGM